MRKIRKMKKIEENFLKRGETKLYELNFRAYTYLIRNFRVGLFGRCLIL